MTINVEINEMQHQAIHEIRNTADKLKRKFNTVFIYGANKEIIQLASSKLYEAVHEATKAIMANPKYSMPDRTPQEGELCEGFSCEPDIEMLKSHTATLE